MKISVELIAKIIIVFAILAVVVFLIFPIVAQITGAVFNAVTSELSHPQQPVVRRTGDLPLADSGEMPSLTGYVMQFPDGTLDWRVTYVSRNASAGTGSWGTVVPTYWCEIMRGEKLVWASCKPVISRVD